MLIVVYGSQGSIDFVIKEITVVNGILILLSLSKRIVIILDLFVFFYWLIKSIKWEVIEIIVFIVEYKRKGIGI